MLADVHPKTSGKLSSEMPSDDRDAAGAAAASAAAAQWEEKEGEAVAAATHLWEKKLSNLKEEHLASAEDAKAREVELEESLQNALKARKSRRGAG